jgi:hypothetical protein
MSEIKSNLATLSTQMAVMMEEVKKNRIDRYRAYSSHPLLRRPLLLHRGEALEIPASLPSEECAQI